MRARARSTPNSAPLRARSRKVRARPRSLQEFVLAVLALPHLRHDVLPDHLLDDGVELLGAHRPPVGFMVSESHVDALNQVAARHFRSLLDKRIPDVVPKIQGALALFLAESAGDQVHIDFARAAV